ncbi:MAG: type II toxin-antitoxin system RelB/DinJ family antitoxin [Eggerthellaceae bacterium]|nr:type II toxin-antitoxin system RelB/DinJ family antitoxin [Eggerthellaceae bacterium]
MANVNVTIRMDEELKKKADALFDELGMSFTTAINVFVRQALREGRIPFQITANASVTYAALDLASSSCLDESETN